MENRTRRSYQEGILRSLVQIQHHLDDELPLTELATVAHFSPWHFHRIFRGMVGESVKEHIRRLRLERAAHRLRYSGQKVVTIALDAGFETHESFTRAFRTMFGVAPSRFRRENRPLTFQTAECGVHFNPAGAVADFRPRRQRGSALAVRIETTAPLRVAFMRHVGPYGSCGPTWERLYTWAGKRGILTATTLCLGVGHDHPEITPLEKVRYDACITVPETIRPEGEIGIQTVGGGRYAVTLHRGHFSTLGDVYERLCAEWIPDNGHLLRAAPSFEIYRSDPKSTPFDEFLTEIHIPLEPEGAQLA